MSRIPDDCNYFRFSTVPANVNIYEFMHANKVVINLLLNTLVCFITNILVNGVVQAGHEVTS